jgi:hypothetical protein
MARGSATILAVTAALMSAAAATPIDDKHARMGGATGVLGAPIGTEAATPDGAGRVRHFANGSIYFHPATGANAVYGLIRKRWNELGAQQGYLGYPMTDEIDTFDRAGKVSKFQGGQLIWRSATNAVSEVKSADLTVDWPFPPGQAWKVIQANAPFGGGSHGGHWAYCWDIILAGKPQSASKGIPFVAVADGRLLQAEEKFPSGAKEGNYIAQALGPGRYASYLHVNPGSWSRHVGSRHKRLPQELPWDDRPVVKSGTVLAEVGDTGAAVGAFHLHFCVTTKPDFGAFAPFESVPVAFRNYSVSTNNGKSWTFVAAGVPRQGDWVRREARPGPSAPQINLDAHTINFGSVKGQLSLPGGQPLAAGDRITVKVESLWGEPLAQQAMAIAAGSAGPWSYEIARVPAFNNLRIVVSSDRSGLAGESGRFELRPNAAATMNVQLKGGAK